MTIKKILTKKPLFMGLLTTIKKNLLKTIEKKY